MASYSRKPVVSPDSPAPPASPLHGERGEHPKSDAVMVLSMEFIATPQDAARVCQMIPEAMTATLKEVAGYAGCLVMSLDQESRLVTVLTFWKGEDRQRCCSENRRWIYKLIGPYLDRCLHERTYTVHPPAGMSVVPGEGGLEGRSARPGMALKGNEVCAA